MARKKSHSESGYVYSTDPDFRLHEEEDKPVVTPAPGAQKLRITLDTRQRAGKAVTLIDQFSGKEEDLETLGKQLKTFCGTGGSVKDGMIIIQGDQREKVRQFLVKNGYGMRK